MANEIAEAGIALPGIYGDAATAATFAGQWSERTKSAAIPFQGHRLYELLEIGEVPNVDGKLRQAGPQDRSLMILWSRAFQIEIGESTDDIELREIGQVPNVDGKLRQAGPQDRSLMILWSRAFQI